MELNIFFPAFFTRLPIYFNRKKEPYNRTTVSHCFDRAKDEIQFIDIDTWVTDSKKN